MLRYFTCTFGRHVAEGDLAVGVVAVSISTENAGPPFTSPIMGLRRAWISEVPEESIEGGLGLPAQIFCLRLADDKAECRGERQRQEIRHARVVVAVPRRIAGGIAARAEAVIRAAGAWIGDDIEARGRDGADFSIAVGLVLGGALRADDGRERLVERG